MEEKLIIKTEEGSFVIGCVISILFIKKFYSWEEYQIKRRERFHKNKWGRKYIKLYEEGVFFPESVKGDKYEKIAGSSFCLETKSIFYSLVLFPNGRKHKNKRERARL